MYNADCISHECIMHACILKTVHIDCTCHIFSSTIAADYSFCIHQSCTCSLVAMATKLLYLLAAFLLAGTAMVIMQLSLMSIIDQCHTLNNYIYIQHIAYNITSSITLDALILYESTFLLRFVLYIQLEYYYFILLYTPYQLLAHKPVWAGRIFPSGIKFCLINFLSSPSSPPHTHTHTHTGTV